jgi:hypothetical protein
MNDKELLRLAAKAAGIKLIFIQNDMPRNCTGMHESMNIFSAPTWNPLTDDGDALRLAVKLKMLVNVMTKGVQVDVENIEDAALENIEGDSYAATRRCITRAAAEIGKSK